jgi:asparagine synthase (glutamine-hydrolysing)
MCGIAGWLGRIEGGADTADSMLAALEHRGPDGNGSRTWDDATLLHTRLRIIDLSPTGDQPMANEDGSVWTVFNGEIYNHARLRSELEHKGHAFRGRSDTEVLPHLYEEHGERMFAELRGMFGIALFDRGTNRLLLARDRFGIKPLFYAIGEDFVAFASEINALRLVPGVDLTPDPQAIADYAAVLYVPAPQTVFQGIRALEPGEMLDCNRDTRGRVQARLRRFHTFTLEPSSDLELGETVGRVEELIDGAVGQQLESDVPLGALLSGGIDSSLVSAFAQRSVGDLRTFSVRMPDPDFDETWAAEAVARHIGSHHETLEVEGRRGSWDEIVSILRQAGQPFADTSIFAVDAVSRAMREHVTVALSGDGGDEGFGGYDMYWQLATIDRLQRVPTALWRVAAPTLDRAARFSSFSASASRRIRDFAGQDDVGVVQALFSWIRPREHERLLADGHHVLPARRLFEPQWSHVHPRGTSRIERLTSLAVEVNVRLVLANDFLPKVDTASMRHSLEVRVPLLDEALMEVGLSLPHRLRVDGHRGKRVLRAIASKHIPHSVIERPKQGFALPVDSWVTADFKHHLREQLLDRASPVAEFLRQDVYAPWVETFCSGEQRPDISRLGLYQRATMLLALDLALRDRARPDRSRRVAATPALVDTGSS